MLHIVVAEKKKDNDVVVLVDAVKKQEENDALPQGVAGSPLHELHSFRHWKTYFSF